jgi:ribA/ribD-fused uncharacterized protein
MDKSKNEIRGFRGDYWFLSNFYPCTIVHDGFAYMNLEAAFQAAKCADLTERAQFQNLQPKEAKALGKTIQLRKDWDNIKLFILKELIILKFISNPGLLASLLETGDAMLVEDNRWHDNYYGNCICPRCYDIQGLNYLGYFLMQYRDRINLIQTIIAADKPDYEELLDAWSLLVYDEMDKAKTVVDELNDPTKYKFSYASGVTYGLCMALSLLSSVEQGRFKPRIEELRNKEILAESVKKPASEGRESDREEQSCIQNKNL